MKKKYDDLSKEELVRLLEVRDRRDATRFGLVWEANEIERDKALNADSVALDLDRDLSCPAQGSDSGGGGWKNLIIEGDNFDALRYLKMCFAGRIKCIYIDPPYNTGNKDFVYNDHFVAKEDLWRHSTWCEFMYQRLTIAKDLLAHDGVILINIGEDEVHNLGLLMEMVFRGRKVGTFVWRTRSGANDSKEYFRSIDHEYVLCYANPGFTFAGNVKSHSTFSNPDNDPRGPWSNDNLVTNKNYRQRANAFYPLHNPDTDVWYPCDPDNTWRFATRARVEAGQRIRTKPIEQLIEEKKILWPNDTRTVRYDYLQSLHRAILEGTAPHNLRLGTNDEERAFWDVQLPFWVGKTIGYGKPRYKRHLSEVKRSEKPLSTWLVPAALKKQERDSLDTEGIETLTVGSTSEGTSLLQEILGNKDFPYPKPLSLIQGLLAQVTNDGDIVLDFFAGSGTSAHATLEPIPKPL